MAGESVNYVGDYKNFEKDLKGIETRIKSEYHITSMPSAWRSAKSVLVKCLKNNIDVFDSNEALRGKSELQTHLKLGVLPQTAYQVCYSTVTKAIRLFIHLSKEEQDIIKKLSSDGFHK
jgi:hypothetical protein